MMKVDKLMTEVDHGARSAYEERARPQRQSDHAPARRERPRPNPLEEPTARST